MKKILTIAGSDSGGGAGIQADLKTITALGGYGMSVITAITAQNTTGVKAIYMIPPELIIKQIDSIFEDFGADAVKTGMLFSKEVVNIVAEKMRRYRVTNLVIDPVMIAKSGDYLLDKEGRIALRKKLIPLAFLITPNLYEASELSGKRVDSVKKMKESAKKILEMGARNVLIKGGHLKGDAIDIFYDGEDFYELREKRINSRHTHGVGCTLSAAIATFLAKGCNLKNSVENAKKYVTNAIKCAYSIGRGISPVNHLAPVTDSFKKLNVLNEVKKAVELLKKENISRLIPEVGSNIGYCPESPKSLKDVAAVPGRILRVNNNVTTVAEPEFGASSHVGKIVLTLNKFDEDVKSAMNIRFSEEILKTCKNLGLEIAEFSRNREPGKVKTKEGATLIWGIEEVLKRRKSVPDIIFDRGDFGKEAMIRVTGKNPFEVANKVIMINRGLK